ncbi:MAG TPA: TetR/AcrR family transcriptional regulator [Solirubrobacteraceae bacterium]
MSELQRVRLLDATFAVVAEDGYRRMTARRVSGRAGVSNKTFYDLFTDREDCFLAAFDHAVDRIAGVVLPAWEGEKEWATRIRAGLGALLGFLDVEPALRRLVFVEALGAGPRVLERRAQVSEVLRRAVDQGRTGVKAGRELPPLTAEGIVGAAFSVIHARLLQESAGSLLDLLNPLMATIVLPYRGHAAAAQELQFSKAGPGFLPTDKPAKSGRSGGTSGSCAGRDEVRVLRGPGGTSGSCAFRPTLRTLMVLAAVAELGERGSKPNNREVSDAAQIVDQGQISKLLARLEGIGLLHNTGGHIQGVPNAWRLTPHGEQVVRATRPHSRRTDGRTSAPRATP